MEHKYAKDHKEVDLWGFALISNDFMIEARDILRANQGFTNKEAEPYLRRFKAKDPKDTGSVPKKEIITLLEEFFPYCKTSEERGAKRAIAEVMSRQGESTLTFQKFLRLLRFLKDDEEKAALDKENDAIAQTSFTTDEVKEFRQIFHMFRQDEAGEMTFEEFQEMMANLIPMGAKNANQLQQLILEHDTDGSLNIDFSEFLLLMQHAKDQNFGGLNDRAEQAAKAREEEKRREEEETEKRLSNCPSAHRAKEAHELELAAIEESEEASEEEEEEEASDHGSEEAATVEQDSN
eukprot:gnl/TRDRNA2_/TRDRNA2_93461_c0_seq1.p1 gnl/TRDRNA2_/TRDRNA2_93461_c0~~gnl/TRDRNA2_/TRDRNA2_93461_c0_seq1.p1  ORF type:complete len:293 (+),score=97.32 gnl/TRDRNA2_/TRDRNA2_93461_c0_seq1:1-879(+)